jgi:hypothetical protein
MNQLDVAAFVDMSVPHRAVAALAAAVLATSLTTSSAFAQEAESLVLDTNGLVGIGVQEPERQLHLRGQNAAFRMDRSVNSAAFILVRTDSAYNPLKAYVIGVNATGENQGGLIINDLGADTSGSGDRRMTINNLGDVLFTGSVSAPEVVNTSSARYKDNIETLTAASASVSRLRGVSFDWKETGNRSLGLIAEEVAAVFPEVVTTDPDSGEAEAVNYSALTAVLVEALKEQRARLDALEAEFSKYRAAAAEHHSQLGNLRTRVNQLEAAGLRVSGVRPNEGSEAVAALRTP